MIRETEKQKMYEPQLIFEEIPELTQLSDFAWKCAKDHILSHEGIPQSPYMDEGFDPTQIWIWDTCFMSLYCKYDPQEYPGIESLRNFYAPMLENAQTSLGIRIPDNPPLFAWAELENYRMTGNRAHLEEIFFVRRYPQKMYELFENFHYGDHPSYMTSNAPVQWEKSGPGYHWSGGRCGMDNTPRGGFGAEIMDNDPAYRSVLFLDAIAQQALSAEIIYRFTGEEHFQQEYERLKKLIKQYYWDEEDGCYYDIEAQSPYRRIKVMTPASFWPLLAGIASEDQAKRMAEHVRNPDHLGGPVPLPSVARNSEYFNPTGQYWRGGVWLPTAYMAVKALERYGFQELANEIGEKIVLHQLKTFTEFAPHTIWEAYSPTEARPATKKSGQLDQICRPDFCGWSALGPINLAIENLLGIHADGVDNKIFWRIHHGCRHGIRQLHFGKITADLIYQDGKISVTSNAPFVLQCGNQEFHIPIGVSQIEIKSFRKQEE